MRRIMTCICIFFIFVLFIVSCNSENNEGVLSLKSTVASVQSEQIKNSDLDELVEDFVFPPKPIDKLNLDEHVPGLPTELINKIKKAVFDGTSDSLIQELNDKSLMIKAEDFEFQPNKSEDLDYYEEDLNDTIKYGASDFFIYKCDTNGDGTDEIIMIQNLEYDYSHSNLTYILKKSGDKYIYSGYDYLGYHRLSAIFKYGDAFYLVANYDDYKTKTTKAVGLFALNGDNNGFMWLINNPYAYIRKTNDGYKYHLLYKNNNSLIVNNIQTYLDEISTDLIYVDRIQHTFYGDETYREDLLDESYSNGNQLFTIDVNNDGQEEFFDRKILYYGLFEETEVTWYNPTTRLPCSDPFTPWRPAQYFLTQRWFKIIGGKTIIFSLYHKFSEDIYLLDARINENNKTTILLDYIIDLETNVELSDYWDYSDSNLSDVAYKDLDVDIASPDDIQERIEKFASKVQGNFIAVDYEDENIPNDLIVILEKALFDDNYRDLDLGQTSFEINKEDFCNNYDKYTYYDAQKKFKRLINHIYKYELDNKTYYLMVEDSGGSARLVDVNIYEETGDELENIDHWISLDLNAKVIEYNNDLYYIESSYNYNSKYTDTISIYKLVPGKVKNIVVIQLLPGKFEWEETYNNNQPYRKEISAYINSIKDDLMVKSPIDGNIEVFLGDEESEFDHDKKLRLKSVGGYYDYYKIDFNNDGEHEYIERHFWFPSNATRMHLQSSFYKITDNRIVSLNNKTFASTLIQLWFKEINGKIFTFRLFLNGGYNYSLSVSLVEDTNITQVQSYIIVPKKDFKISSYEHSPKD